MSFEMPHGLRIVRSTPEFTHDSTPDGLRRAHRVAAGVWGRLRVLEGLVIFVFEDSSDAPITVTTGGHVDIPPDTPHHVVTEPGCRFLVEFHTA